MPTKIRPVQTLLTHCSRASRWPRHSVLWPEEAIVTRKYLFSFPGKADTDHRCSFIREPANLYIPLYLDSRLLSLVYRIACCPRADQMLPTMLASRTRLIGHDDAAATSCSRFATVPGKSGRFALHTLTRCYVQSFIWDSYDI